MYLTYFSENIMDILDLICMKIINSDSQCISRIILVEKLPFERPNWNILFEITYESKPT